jgi:hypothetical protein
MRQGRTSRRGFTRLEVAVIAAAFGGLGIALAPQMSKAEEDPRARSVSEVLSEARLAVERWRERRGEYPDLCQKGWSPLVEGGFLDQEPTNPLNGRSQIGGRAGSGAGWHYDRSTGALGACYFDELTERVTPETP